jgi:hypothetical protein
VSRTTHDWYWHVAVGWAEAGEVHGAHEDRRQLLLTGYLDRGFKRVGSDPVPVYAAGILNPDAVTAQDPRAGDLRLLGVAELITGNIDPRLMLRR